MLVSSVTGAYARGQMAFGQTLEICANGEAVTVVLDAHGTPVRALHLCPECAAVSAGLPPPLTEIPRPNSRWARIAAPVQVLQTEPTPRHAVARGPPALI